MSDGMFPIETKHFYIQPSNEKKLWGEDWAISPKKKTNQETTNQAEVDTNTVGHLRFEHALFHGELELSLELDATHNTSGYIAEIFFTMARFVFKFKDIKEISTVCRHEDDNYVRGLEKAGYVRRETKDGKDHYSMKKQQTGWTGLYLIIGMCAGFIIGILIANLKLGTLAGVIIGIIIGYLMDKRVEKKPVFDNKPLV
ncbi:hypothetical protein [Butyrivibrio sp. JL13D10]|uniref:hypothetical protein n=1 Tax=Butyrivibrio sp. JL13D10 TaxID=3236815 RepID=UPI0038B58D1C